MADKKISESTNISSVQFKESAAPATPASGFGKAYAKTDGKLYFKNDAGVESDLTASGGAGSDTDAIHDNVASEISAITEKVSPISGDLLLIEDSADSNNKKKVQIGNLPSGTDADAIHDNVASEISAVTEKASPVSGDLLLIEDSADSNNKKRIQIGNLPASGANHDWFVYAAAQLEPLALEETQLDTFSYTVGASETKILIGSGATRIGGSGIFQLIDPRKPVPMRNTTLIGTGASSQAYIINPATGTYSDARTTYYDRLNTLYELDTKYIAYTNASTDHVFFPGPYGNIITSVSTYRMVNMLLKYDSGNTGVSLMSSGGGTSAEYQTAGHALMLPVSQNTVSLVRTGAGDTGFVGGLTHCILPSTWGAVTDTKSYDFRDDFMGSSLDTATKWTRTESSTDNVQIDTTWQWCKMIGSGAWNANGMRSQTSITKAAGKVFECTVGFDAVAGTGQGMVGFNDGGGVDDSNMSYGVNFSSTGSLINIYENGTARGTVGSGFSAKSIYRVRITCTSGNNATYEIQGGTQYAPIGGSTWTDITPGTSSSTDTTLYAAATMYNGTTYVSDIKMY